MVRLLLSMLAATVLLGCAPKVDRFVVNRVVPRGLEVPDLGKACALGESLSHPLASLSAPDRPAHKAMVIAELTAGVCAEEQAWEAELDGLRATRAGDPAGTRDARIREDRARTIAADRYWRSFLHLEAAFGEVGEACPRIRERDEVVYLVGLVSGLLGLLHDRGAGGPHGVPLDALARIGRGAPCLDDEAWWHVPSALQAGAWATIPGSAPEGVDPWARLETHAALGEAQGVRVARALQVLLGANAGRDSVVTEGIQAHAASLSDTEQGRAHALLDEYARRVTLHQSDVIWMGSEGFRTRSLGRLPGDTGPETPAPEDPFAEDPFAAPPPAEDPDAEEETP